MSERLHCPYDEQQCEYPKCIGHDPCCPSKAQVLKQELENLDEWLDARKRDYTEKKRKLIERWGE